MVFGNFFQNYIIGNNNERRGKKKDKDASSPTGGSTKLYLQESLVRETIRSHVPNTEFPSLEHLVALPVGFDTREWIAWHTISFFDQLNTFIELVGSDCNGTSCPCMAAPGNTMYQWTDDKGRKVKCTAPQYIDYITTYIHGVIEDRQYFPTRYGDEFPANFNQTIQKLYRYMFHVISHIFNSHYPSLVIHQLNGHLNTFFAHFMLFSSTHKLLDDREAENMLDLINAIKSSDVYSQSNSGKETPSPPGTDTPPQQ